MGLPERLYYTVEEVAERWNKPVDDLWHFAADGKFFLSIWHKGYCFEEDFEWKNKADSYREFEIDDGYETPTANLRFEATALDGIIDITKETAIEFITLPLKEFIKTSYLMIDNIPRVLALKTSTEGLRCSVNEECFVPETIKIEKKMVVVAPKEVKRMEEKHPELLGKAPGQLYAQHVTQEPTVVPREAEKPLFQEEEPEQVMDNAEFDNAFVQACRLSEIAREKVELNSLKAQSPREVESRKNQLHVLDKERMALQARENGGHTALSNMDSQLPAYLHSSTELEVETPDLFKTAGQQQAEGDVAEVTQHQIGGAPKASITEAVEHAYNILLKSGNTEIIKKGNIKGFVQYLKECVTEGNPNYSDYVAERILEVKAVHGDCKIIMRESKLKEKMKFANNCKHEVIKKARISAILSAFRKR